MKKIVLLGASGSIGSQTIEVISKYRKEFSLLGFSLGKRTRKISFILNKFPEVKFVCIQDESKVRYYQNKFPHITFFSGDEGLLKLINNDCDLVVNALVGFVGLCPSIECLKLNKTLLLANKESLVIGGEQINHLLKEGHGKLIPIDSEHVAIDKCLSVDDKDVKNIILTASGGSFRHLKRSELKNITLEKALNHPTWKMGKKITIDSATMMNKCFEIIEAHYLFNLPYERIKILLHDESYVHSLVQYNSGLYRMEISKPNMKNPIKYALFERNLVFETHILDDLNKLQNLHFKKFDYHRFPIVKWAKKVIEEKGTYGCCLNAANEEAVNAFLNGEVKFTQIEDIINLLMEEHIAINNPSINDMIEIHVQTRKRVRELIKGGN